MLDKGKWSKLVLSRGNWKRPALVAGSIFLLLIAVYYILGYYLSNQIQSKYGAKDCEGVLTISSTLQKFYPVSVAPFYKAALSYTEECEIYIDAGKHLEHESWAEAFADYQKYLNNYQEGIFNEEARQNAALSLFAWANLQHQSKDFSGAMTNLLMLETKFPDSVHITEAREMIPEIYIEWGRSLGDNRDYLEAENILSSFYDWARQNGDDHSETRANLELARLYFVWAENLYDLNDYENAIGKYELAITMDPEPASTEGPAARSKTALAFLHETWGDELIVKEQYQEAAHQYAASVSNLSEEASDMGILFRRHIKWAEALSHIEDFYGALDIIAAAEELALSDAAKSQIKSARENIYFAFSESKGDQSRALMDEVTDSVCQLNDLSNFPPVLGIDPDHVRVSIYYYLPDLNEQLAGDIQAEDPGDLHYIACVVPHHVVVDTCEYIPKGQIERVRSEWIVILYESKTGKIYSKKTLKGEDPPRCPYLYDFGNKTTAQLVGEPTLADLETWLRKFTK
jgi:tetratricopeptide (TPR) repeat protein